MYKEETAPLIEYYKNKNIFREIDASGSIEDVAKRIKEVILNN